METIESIEARLGYTLPDEYSQFLLEADHNKYMHTEYCRVLKDGYKTSGSIDEIVSINNFWEQNEFRDYLKDFETHFENLRDYVEAGYLYHIASGGNGAVCIALNGVHKSKIYSADNGDHGIIYQTDTLNEFLKSLYKTSDYQSTYQELIDAAKNANLNLLRNLIETKDGNKLINHSSWLDIELFDIAYKNNSGDILRYLISKGYTGHNRIDYYKLNIK